jgi:hypothetical protein
MVWVDRCFDVLPELTFLTNLWSRYDVIRFGLQKLFSTACPNGVLSVIDFTVLLSLVELFSMVSYCSISNLLDYHRRFVLSVLKWRSTLSMTVVLRPLLTLDTSTHTREFLYVFATRIPNLAFPNPTQVRHTEIQSRIQENWPNIKQLLRTIIRKMLRRSTFEHVDTHLV